MKAEQSVNNGAAWGKVLVPSHEIYITISLSSAGTNTPTQREDGNFRLSTSFLKHQPVISPQTKQEWASLVAEMVKNPPAMRETWIRSLGWEDALEKGMVTHSSILAWRIPWTEVPGGLQSMESQRIGHD